MAKRTQTTQQMSFYVQQRRQVLSPEARERGVLSNVDLPPAPEPWRVRLSTWALEKRTRTAAWYAGLSKDTAVRMAVITGLCATAIAFLIGLMVFGWWLWPVQWTDGYIPDLADSEKEKLVLVMSDLYAFNGNDEQANLIFGAWQEEAIDRVCASVWEADSSDEQWRRLRLAAALGATACPIPEQTESKGEPEG